MLVNADKDGQVVPEVDPNVRQLQNASNFTHRARFVFNVDTEEVLTCSLESI